MIPLSNKYGNYFGAILGNTIGAETVISEKISAAGNRSQRRKILKTMAKTETIAKYANERIRKEAGEELIQRSNDSFGYIMSMVGIILHDKYKWEDEEIGGMFTEVSERLNGKWSEGKSVDDVAKELLEKTGIELVVR